MTLILSYWNNSVSVGKEWHYLNGTVQLLIALISLVLNIIMLFCIKRYLFYLEIFNKNCKSFDIMDIN